MVSGEQKLFEAYIVRGCALQSIVNVTVALGESFKRVTNSFAEAAREFNRIVEQLRG